MFYVHLVIKQLNYHIVKDHVLYYILGSINTEYLYNRQILNKININNNNFGIKNELGYEIKEDNVFIYVYYKTKKIHVPYLPCVRGISMRPESNNYCSVVYDLDEKYTHLDFIVLFYYYSMI